MSFQCLNGIHADSNTRAYARAVHAGTCILFQCLNGIHADSNRREARREARRLVFQCLNGIHADSNSPPRGACVRARRRRVSMPERHSCGF